MEPGKYAQIGCERYSLNIRNDFFNVDDWQSKFDIIIFYGVLEHISNYKRFLEDIKTLLSNNAKIILSVPDCEPYLKNGDISVFLHEHWNYFTESTLLRVLNSVGLECVMEKAGYGGAIYAAGTVKKKKLQIDNYTGAVINSAIAGTVNKMRKFFVDNKQKVIGVYCPVRIINYYTILKLDREYKIRFFDDDIRFHGLFFPGIDICIEDYSDLENESVDIMLIASLTFAELIKKKLSRIGISCITLKEILDEDSYNF